MVYRTRIKYTEDIRAEIWGRYQRGESLCSIGRYIGRPTSSIYGQLAPTGGIRPPERKRSTRVLSLAEREEISRGLVADRPIRAIASQLGRSPSTISREINRNGGQAQYRAHQADQNAWDRAKRPKRCKLSCYPSLCRVVETKLRKKWSPQQIAGWLNRKNPYEESKRVSHEGLGSGLTFYIKVCF